MNLLEKIEKAFNNRVKPRDVIESQKFIGPDEKDALWFAGRDWREITWDDWEKHSGAFYAFNVDAFIYYLPNVLSLSVQQPERWLAPAQTLLNILDRSPKVEYWDAFMIPRLVGLESTQYQILKEWLLFFSERKSPYSEDTLGRAFDTVGLLHEETERRLNSPNPGGY